MFVFGLRIDFDALKMKADINSSLCSWLGGGVNGMEEGGWLVGG